MIAFVCHICRTPLQVEDHQAGDCVRCPTCSSTLRVPAFRAAASPSSTACSTSDVPGQLVRDSLAFLRSRTVGRRYAFNCPYCSSRLEATQAQATLEGQCPTCGKLVVVPILDRYGRLIHPSTRQIIRQDPHPVHAYAAAGDRAPRIVRRSDGSRVIQCSRCAATSPIHANCCQSCGMPFTMEGTVAEAAGFANGFCVASLVLGIISIPAAVTLILPLLAVILGIIGYTQASRTFASGSGKGMAIAGILCGGLGLIVALIYFGTV